MFTVGIVGKDGQLGRELLRAGADSDCTMLAYGHDDVDIADKKVVNQVLAGKPLNLIINAAAFTAVDRAETDVDVAFNVNAEGPGNLAAFCSEAAIPLIHLSTDYVFDGTQNIPYKERDPISPLGIYGKSKAQGEHNIRKRLKSHIIIRTSWLYSPHGENFLKTMLRLGSEKSILKVVNDQEGCPTSAADLATVIWNMIDWVRYHENDFWGTYHYCNQGTTTWHGMAKAIFEHARNYPDYPMMIKELLPIPTSEYPTPAERPAYSVLDCHQIKKTFRIDIRGWREALQNTMDQLFSHLDHESLPKVPIVNQY